MRWRSGGMDGEFEGVAGNEEYGETGIEIERSDDWMDLLGSVSSWEEYFMPIEAGAGVEVS
jgi:hypothetical protein